MAHAPINYDHLISECSAFLSENQLKAHFTLYQGYVKKLNEIEEKLAKADPTTANYSYSEYSELRRREPVADRELDSGFKFRAGGFGASGDTAREGLQGICRLLRALAIAGHDDLAALAVDANAVVGESLLDKLKMRMRGAAHIAQQLRAGDGDGVPVCPRGLGFRAHAVTSTSASRPLRLVIVAPTISTSAI